MGHMMRHHGMHGKKVEGFHRKFYTKDEKREWLSKYVDELKKELAAAEEKLKEM